uniref:Intraflagellar transport 74 n=1 Tax=Panagrolaimus sp. PS1159 TaxID=55785 RepID=A0AC35FQA8_9BILA
MADGIVVGSRAGPPISSSYGNRPATTARLATAASGNRPMTASRMLPPGTGVQRPVTQQGLTGVRAQSRAGTAFGSRIIMDKTYFMGLLNTQLADLDVEIESLEKELIKFESEQQKLLFYEQRAEEQAEEIKKLQGELSDYNLLIDYQNTNKDFSELQFEVQEEQTKNAEISKQVEDLFRERREKEDASKILETQVHEIRIANENLINSMDPGIRDEYENIHDEAEHLSQMLEEKQKELETLTKRKEEIDVALANNPLKQQAMVLQEQIAELEMKKAEVAEQLNDKSSPEELRERLVEQIKKDNDEISNMQQVISEFEEKMQQSHEELQEFENEYDIMAGEKNEKYRELRQKEIQIDEFVQNFDTKKHEIEIEIEKHHLEVIRLLQLISLNCTASSGYDTVNASSVDESSLEMAANPEELQNLHVRLQEELIDLEEAKKRLIAEMESMHHRENEIVEGLHEFRDIDGLQHKIMQTRENLVSKRNEYHQRNPQLESDVRRLQSQLSEISNLMSTNQEFQKLNSQKTVLNAVLQEQEELKAKVEAKTSETNYDEIKNQAMKLRHEYNLILVAAYANGKK